MLLKPFLTSLLSIALVNLALPIVAAEAISAATPHPAVVRVVVPEEGGTAFGSGTLIDLRDDYGLVLTNWHVVRDATGPIEVQFPSGFRSKARALKVDSEWDLAALVIWRPSVDPVRLATRAPRPGDRLTICGYGQGDYRAVSGRCTQYYAPRLDLPRELVELDIEARQGDSGGPIFNDQGELAGVLFGAGQGTTLGSFEGRVKTFLASLAPDIGHRELGPQDLTPNENAPKVALASAAPCRSAGSTDRWTRQENSQESDHWCAKTELPSRSGASSSDWKPTFRDAPNPTKAAKPTANQAAALPPVQPLAATSSWELAKNILAAIGALALVAQVSRLAG